MESTATPFRSPPLKSIAVLEHEATGADRGGLDRTQQNGKTDGAEEKSRG